MDGIKKFFAVKTLVYYVVNALAIISIVIGIVYLSGLKKGYESIPALIFLIAGGIGACALSIKTVKGGAALLAVSEILSFGFYVCKSFLYIKDNNISEALIIDGEFIKIIVLACLMLAVFTAANVIFYVAGNKKQTEVID